MEERNGKTYYSLKEKYEYYKKLATGTGLTKNGKKADFCGRVASANKANSIRRKMGYNKRYVDFLGSRGGSIQTRF